MTEGHELSDETLLKDGLLLLERALMLIMEMSSEEGKALVHFVHAAICYGELHTESVRFSESKF